MIENSIIIHNEHLFKNESINIMKQIFIIIIALLLNENVFSQYNKLVKKIDDLDLKGNIESIKIKETAVSGPKYSLVRKHIISDVEFKIISENIVLPTKHIEQGIVVNYKYNNTWQIAEIENKYLDKYNVSAGKKIYYYDNRGTLKYELDFDKEGKLKDSISVSFNDGSEERLFYTADKIFYKKEIISYNEQKNELANFQEIGGSNTRIVCEYDSTGTKVMLEKWYLDNRLLQTIKYFYDERGLLISKIDYDEKGLKGSTTIFEYDLITGLVISVKAGENITLFDYNFDINDNWIVKYEYYNDYPVKVVERIITYRNE